MIHHTKLFVRRLAYTPWLLVAGLVLGWAGAAVAQDTNGLSVADASAQEDANVVFTVTSSAPVDEDVTVRYVVRTERGNTASIGVDYTGIPGTATIAANTQTTTISIAVTDDALDEGDNDLAGGETFTLELLDPSGDVVLVDAIAIGRIIDNDAQPVVTVAAPAEPVTEGDPAAFVVTLTPASGLDVTVTYTASFATGQTATAADLGDLTGTVTIAAGATTGTASVATVNDDLDEGVVGTDDEAFTLTLSAPVNATLGGTVEVTASIADNDNPPTLSVMDATADENSLMEFMVELSAASGLEITVDYTTGNDLTADEEDRATPGADYVAVTTAATLTIAAGQSSGTIYVPIIADNLLEDSETFVLTLSNPSNATLSATTGSATGTISSQYTMVSVSDMSSALEGEAVDFTVSLSTTTTEDVTVQYSTANGTATAGEDYEAASGETATIDAGELSTTVSIETLEDGIIEGDETFTVTLSNATNATLDTDAASGEGTITDDDVPPSLSVADASAAEGMPVEFTVSLMTDEVIEEVTVEYTISVGEGDTAAESADFSADAVLSGTLTFAVGATGDETKQTVSVMTQDDGDDENNENFTLTLSEPMNATITDGSAVGTILDNDGPPSLSVVDASAEEGEAVAFTVTLTLPNDMARNEDVTVMYATSSGTATEGTDYTAKSGTLNFAADAEADDQMQIMKTVSVATTDDEISEGAETFTLTLSSVSANAEIGTGTATGTINASDGTPMVSVADASADEGEEVKFEVRLSKASTSDVIVEYEVVIVAGNSASPDDVALRKGTVTIRAGELKGTVSVATTDDEIREGPETFTLRLLSVESKNAAIDANDGSATGTIPDDEPVPAEGQIRLTLTPAEVREAAGTTTEVSVTASVDSPTDAAVTVSLVLSGTATEGTDYTVSGTQSITIAAGATLDKTALTFTPINDAAYEGDETIRITATATGYTSGSTRVTLIDDDEPSTPVSSGGGGASSPPPPPPPPPSPSFDDETIAAQFYIQGTAIDPLVFPTAQDGTKPLTYGLSQTSTAQAAIDPLTGLPDSLAFDPKTRTLTGTPATSLPATEFSYTVIDADGRTASLCFDITIYALIGPPTPPTDLTVAFDADGKLVLHWKEPARNGGYDLTSYEVQYQKTTSASWRGLAIRVPANHPTKTYTIGGLQADADYNVRVRAYNLNPLPDLSLGEWAMASTDETAMPAEIAAGTGEPAADGAVCKPGVGGLLATEDAGDGEPSGDGDGDDGEPTVPSAPGAPTKLTATPGDGKLLLRWKKPTQTGGFDLTFYDLQYQRTTSDSWISVAIRIPANHPIKTYSIGGLQNDVAHNVRVRVHNLNPDPELSVSAWTTATATPTEDAAAKQVASVAASFELAAAYPNPFNPSTTIGYALPQDADVRLDIYNVMGQRVRTLVAAHQPAGYYAVEWKATDDSGHTLSSGVYFYRLQAGAFRATKRMLLMR